VTAPHFFTTDVSGEVVHLTGDEAAHAARVLRIRTGEVITVADGSGAVVTATVTHVGSTVDAAVSDRRRVPQPTPRVTVMPAVPKSGKLDLVVQKLTELGVDAIVPWFAERTIVRWDDRKRAAHADRLAAIAREAAKQSRRPRLPEVSLAPSSLEVDGSCLVLHEAEHGVHLREALPATADAITLVIGPEGGLTDAEVERARTQGAGVVGLGEQILRAETASIVAAALVLARYGRLG
jgi:16S rRNA (uracil1498-N3)-methyltransferase